ncbi:hypothetical protein QAD02_021829 [Eretmocerus hayati]|uniref:Uncharacterized protein n=1 Tax=Eretmocerus hayati TaxID=131215 RepID=A0ACC2PT98_9HYME|nr:hypothetical protein QAD02_021829 [Eretmocerus hayati]
MDRPSHSKTTSSAGYSGDLETQNAREVIKEVSKTLGVLNTDMRLTHKRCLNETSDQITESLTEKMTILNPRFEESSIPAEEARYYREIIDQLLEKLSNCENPRERYLLLSVLPKRWSAYQIRKIMGVSQATAERAKELVENQGILCLVPSKSGKVLNPGVLNMIMDFYTSDDKSRIQPGKNDHVPVLINRERVEIQKRLLLCNSKECYQSFEDEHPEGLVGFSRFAEARPPYVISAGATGTHTVCVCEIHQEFELLIHAVDLESIDDQLRKWNYKDILARIICSSLTHECYLRKCPSCPDIHVIVDEITRMFRRESINEITFKQWNNVDRSALETFIQKLPQVMTNEAIPSLKKVIYVSDGAPGQYENRFNFQNLCSHQRDFAVAGEWHFFATSHSKGPWDGVGGTLKRAATKASLQRPLDNPMTTARELFAWAQTLDTSMKIIFVHKEEIIENEKFLNERNEGVKTVQGTRSYHSFEPLNEKTIRVRDYQLSLNYKNVTMKRKEK